MTDINVIILTTTLLGLAATIFLRGLYKILNKRTVLLATSAALVLASCGEKSPTEKSAGTERQKLTNFVDPFIGTADHGHTYPGATVPFGMVQLSPDNGISDWDWCSGYNYIDSVVVGFSHTHLSGTGIGDLCDVLLMPTNADVDFSKRIKSRDDYDFKSLYSHDKESASPGYYSVWLEDPKIQVELTATERAGFHKYTFDNASNPSVVLDLSYAVNWDRPTKTFIRIENDSTVSGYRFSKGWADDQRVFFHIQFSKPFTSFQAASDTLIQEKGQTEIESQAAKALFAFDLTEKEEVLVKVGISSASAEGAKNNLYAEIPAWDFAQVRQDAENKWEKELQKVKVNSQDKELKTIFYTALYHSQLAPVLHSDRDGMYKGANGEYIKAEGFDYYTTFSLWDTFRANNPLFTILQQDRVNDMIRSMLAFYKEHGLLPVWALSANETNTMTGYHAIPVIADAYLKGFRDYDVELAFEAMKASGMQDIRGVKFLKEYNYIPSDLEVEAVTKTLEYAYDDWCIAQVAKEMGKTEDYEYFMNRATSYRNIFDPVTGFMRGKMKDGSWRDPFDPKRSSHRVDTDYTEGNAWQHSWFVPHDVQGLINLFGSKERFITKLDSLFSESSEITGENVSVDISGLIGQYAHGNEPSHHIAYMYTYAGAPWKTQETIRDIMKKMYTTEPNGLCGNEDCGQMSAWYLFSAMGFYPVNPAEGVYVIGSPLFEATSIEVGAGKTFTVKAENVSKENKYIQEASLNGAAFNKTYITHQEVMAGGELVLKMGKEPNKAWATASESIPPSMSPSQL
ncbi:GH92 family glycosyl hydrolase [Rapidithrix thailandica]|uniref:GH92 family glycosyl hydrolase n=1 Tax=Rapidithrix thailandica TaxID=413964 RepID=A0AAW9S616_9BACT